MDRYEHSGPAICISTTVIGELMVYLDARRAGWFHNICISFEALSVYSWWL